MQLARLPQHSSRPARASRAGTVRVQAKVNLPPGAPRVVRGKAFVTKDVSFFCVCVRFGAKCGSHAQRAPRLSLSRRHSHNSPQNIDTDQIIPAEYLTLVPSKVCACVRFAIVGGGCVCCVQRLPHTHTHAHTNKQRSKPDEYEKLGSYALIGLPDDLYKER